MTTKIFYDLARKKDYSAIVELAADLAVRTITEVPGNEQEDTTFETFIKDITAVEPGKTEPSEENKAIMDGIIAALADKVGKAIVDTERSIENCQRKIKNNEYPTVSLVAATDKGARTFAKGLTYHQTPAGLRSNSLANVAVTMQFANIGPFAMETTNKINTANNRAVVKAFSEEFPNKKLNAASALDTWRCAFTNVNGYDYKSSFALPGETVFQKTNPFYDKIKGSTDQELVDAIAKQEALKALFDKDKDEMHSLAEDAKALSAELAQVEGLDKNNKAVSDLIREVDNAVKYGTPDYLAFATTGNEGDKNRQKNGYVTIHTFSDAIETLEVFCGRVEAAYKDQDTAEAKAAKAAVDKVNALKERHRSKLKQYRENWNRDWDERDGKHPEDLIKIIKQEQKNRLLNNEKTQHLAEECVINDQKSRLIGCYIDSAQRGLDILYNASSFMTEDKKTHGRPSGSYTNFANAMEELRKVQASNTSPAELIEKMQTAYDAAAQYENKHTGYKHFLTGYSDKGKDRILYSQIAKAVLGQKLEELRAQAERIAPMLNGLKPDTVRARYEIDSDSVRQQLEAERKKLADIQAEKENAKPVDLDEQIRKAQETINAAKQKAGDGAYPDKNELAEQYAVIVAAIGVKRASKGSANKITRRSFNSYRKVIENGKAFKELINKGTLKSLYDQSSASNGQQLYDSFAKVFKELSRSEEAKRPDAAQANKEKKLGGPSVGCAPKK